MHTVNTIWIHAAPEHVFRLAVVIEDWPAILPHYRWVHIQHNEHGQCVAEMSAQRWRIPVKWTSIQAPFPDKCRISYQHIHGITKGMEVEWQLLEEKDGTKAVIIHDLKPQHWLLRYRLASWIASEIFVKGIADRTLLHIKMIAERDARSERDRAAHEGSLTS